MRRFSSLSFRLKFSLIVFLSLLLVSCPPKSYRAQGYIDVRYTYVSSNVSGRIQKLLVSRGDTVKKDQLLFILEAEPEKSQLDQAKFQVMQARDQLQTAVAELALAKITLDRQVKLEKKEAIDIQTVDQTRTRHKQAVANQERAINNLQAQEAVLERAKWFYSEKKIQSVKDGRVFDTFYLPGELVPPDTPILALISKKNIYAIFYVNGLMLNRLAINQKVMIYKGDSNPIPARITFISPVAEYTPPVIYSNQTNHKLVFRVEVTPLIPTFALHPGEPVETQF